MPLSFQQRDDLKQRFFPNADSQSVGVVRAALERHLQVGDVVLDAGSSGGTWVLRRYANDMRLVVGADVAIPDTMATGEREAEPVVTDLATLPFDASSYDLILCYNVIEHLVDPDAVFAEFARVLKPHGILIFKAPAFWSPVILFSYILPFSVHRLFKSLLGVGADDVFPTYYRCNTTTKLHRALSAAGLQQELLITVDQTYGYFYFSRITYALGLLYSRLTNLPGLRWLHNAIIGVYVKPV
ncbi:MAG TPA: class I SAM-dependent methyltransferase [Caldilineae bacterium]|nr:class I SAM-dependent methyltransferase [Caldilineae bacterium]